jgi:hypothetical protein
MDQGFRPATNLLGVVVRLVFPFLEIRQPVFHRLPELAGVSKQALVQLEAA